MDHLPYISNAQINLPQVPYLIDESFSSDATDLADFEQYWEIFLKEASDDDAEASAYFQSSIYFGTLIKFLAVHSISLQYEDFRVDARGQKFLTTRYLWGYPAAWVANASPHHSVVLENFKELGWHWDRAPADWERVDSVVTALYCILETACTVLHRLSPHRIKIIASVWDSTFVLLPTLENTLERA